MFFVRTATERDLAKVQALLTETWHATHDASLGVERVTEVSGRWHSVKALKTRLEARGAEFVVADNGEAIAGMGFAIMSTDEPQVALLQQLYVLPKHQGHGIGGDIFSELETCFPDANRMRVEVEPANGCAIRFFESLGFEKTGEGSASGAGGSDVPVALYEKSLVV